jgi:hypothetical protein
MKRANIVNEEAPTLTIENERRSLGEIRYSQKAMANRMIRAARLAAFKHSERVAHYGATRHV